jgi:hypothetical protein
MATAKGVQFCSELEKMLTKPDDTQCSANVLKINTVEHLSRLWNLHYVYAENQISHPELDISP